ncbi:YbaB/EbfC family nucleoid-associated protein [Actinopolymorpha sp. B9G3]|uniref:YbaB/EbfC family nucleoid-associated protein n=1 Tax=Actinopolymorpha sp. B9G3 TaxID=3158970 RepID=UPI0032D929C2
MVNSGESGKDGGPVVELLDLAREAVAEGGDPVETFRPLQEGLSGIVHSFTENLSRQYDGSAADGEIVAVVNGLGNLLSIEIGLAAMRDMDAAALSSACTDAIAAAQLSVTEEMKSVMIQLADPDDFGTALPDPMAIWRNSMEASGWKRRT